MFGFLTDSGLLPLHPLQARWRKERIRLRLQSLRRGWMRVLRLRLLAVRRFRTFTPPLE